MHGQVAKSIPGRAKHNVRGQRAEMWFGIVGRPEKLGQKSKEKNLRDDARNSYRYMIIKPTGSSHLFYLGHKCPCVCVEGRGAQTYY